MPTWTGKFLLFTGASVVGIAMTWYMHSRGWAGAHIDANAHVLASRFVSDSLTPGMSQLGYWGTFFHLLLSPFTAIGPLYRNGFSGAALLIPVFSLGVLLLYLLCRDLSSSRVAGFVAAAVFMLNPYVLLYATMPMMEVLFITSLLGTAYFTMRGVLDPVLGNFLKLGIFVAITSISRYEGLVLFPLETIFIAWHLRRLQKPFEEIAATLLLFILLAGSGLAFLMFYGWYFGGNPFLFTQGGWTENSYSFQTILEEVKARPHSMLAIRKLLYAAYLLIDKSLVLFSILSVFLIILSPRERFLRVTVLLVLIAPTLFVLFALMSGRFHMHLQGFENYPVFTNERYVLSAIGFVITASVLTLSAMPAIFGSHSLLLSRIISYLLLLTPLFICTVHAHRVIVREDFYVFRNTSSFLGPEISDDARLFSHEYYDSGKVLLVRADFESFLTFLKFPLENIIYEANYLFYEQSLEEPWLFVRWVIVPSETRKKVRGRKLLAVTKTSRFLRYYDLAFANKRMKIYKLRQEQLREDAPLLGYVPERIPSLNLQMERWNPRRIHERMRVP